MRKSKHVTPAKPSGVIDWAGVQVQRVEYQAGTTIFTQGDPASSVMYIAQARYGYQCCLMPGKRRSSRCWTTTTFSARAVSSDSRTGWRQHQPWLSVTIVIVEKPEMVRQPHTQPAFADRFLTHMLTRNIRIEEDLIDQLFNSSEKRLARTLLLLARYGEPEASHRTLPKVSQETLAEMVGTTRSRVNFFMNKFRKLGFIDKTGGLKINNSLLSVVLRD